MYQQLGLRELKPTRLTLQLVNKSIRVPHDVEDVLIEVGEFILPTDFIMLETQSITNLKGQILVILGRPFLAISNVVINCRMD